MKTRTVLVLAFLWWLWQQSKTPTRPPGPLLLGGESLTLLVRGVRVFVVPAYNPSSPSSIHETTLASALALVEAHKRAGGLSLEFISDGGQEAVLQELEAAARTAGLGFSMREVSQ